MHVQFEAGGVRSDLEVQPGSWTVGGGADDGIRFPGLASQLLELELGQDRVWVRCAAPCPVGRAVLGPGVRRWLLPGERVRLSAHAWLWVEATVSVPATLALVRALLDPGGAPAFPVGPLLACVAGPDAGRVFPLVDPVSEVGRLPGCPVQVGDRAVSRRHLQLVLEGGAHRVRDLGGRNRPRCNGRWLRTGRGVLLADGDILEVGRSLMHYRTAREEPPLTASATAPPGPPAAPSDAGAGRRSS